MIPMSEAKSMSSSDIRKKVKELSQEMFKLRMKASTGAESVKPHEFRVRRKSIARLETALQQLEARS